MTLPKEMIDRIVDRFLSWKLPHDFAPDCGISFKPDYNQHTPWPAKHEPVGTNLFSAEQARAMIEHLLADECIAPAVPSAADTARALQIESDRAYSSGYAEGYAERARTHP